MKITVLIENTASGDLACEHGLSILIEHQGRKILLDAGSTELFVENARILGMELEQIDTAVLSHGHYDHSGGFTAFFEQNKQAKVYAQKGAEQPYHSGNGGMHEIGIPKEILSYKDRFVFVEGFRELFEGIYLVPHHTQELWRIGEKAKLYKEEQGKIMPDDFAHEQSLVFDTVQGLVIFNSCSHGGVGNIIRETKEACGGKRVYAYIGGFHMKGKRNGEEICAFSEDEVDALCEQIRKEQVSYVYTGHCTGLPGFEKLKERLKDTVQPLTTGLQITL